MKRLVKSALAISASLCLLTACASSPSEKEQGEESETLSIAYQTDLNSLDPDNNFEVQGLSTLLSVYEGLVRYKAGSTELEGALAKSWETSSDKKTYTFNLRHDVVFHDGEEMTSEDVKDSFERRMSGEGLALSYFLANVSKLDSPDDYTFIVELESPQPSFLDNLASPWGPKVVGPSGLKRDADADKVGGYLDNNTDGTGPYRLSKFDRGNEYVLEVNDSYWGKEPSFKTVHIGITSDISQQILQLRDGELDSVIHGYPFSQLNDVPEDAEIVAYDDLGLEMAFVNVAHLDEGERITIQRALNPSNWIHDAFGDWATPAESLFPKKMLEPTSPWQWPTSGGSTIDHPIEIVYSSEETNVQKRVADILIVELKSLGVEATARSISANEIQNYVEDPDRASADIVLAQNNPDSAYPGSQVDLFYRTDGALNIFGYSSPEADKLFDTAEQTDDEPSRNDLFLKGAQQAFKDGAFLPLADIKDIIVANKSVGNVVTRPAIPWNFDFSAATPK